MPTHAKARELLLGIAALLTACTTPPPPPPATVQSPPAVASTPPAAPPAVAVEPPPSPTPPPAATPEPSPPPRPPALPAVTAGPCVPPRPPAIRTGGDLTVTSPPRVARQSIGLRLRTQVEGPLTRGSPRNWVGPEVPGFVFLTAGTRELTLLDQAPDGFVALYRDPYGASSCALSGNRNCSYGVAFFECAGRQRWLLLLDPIFSRPDHLEVQDVRYADGVVYFNEACQSYSREAGGRCSSLVAVEPLTRTVVWRTPPLVSNNVFLVHQRYLITGYGFTGEPDALFIVRRADGKVVQRLSIASAHQGLSLDPDGTLTVHVYNGSPLLFRAEGFDSDRPRLTAVRR